MQLLDFELRPLVSIRSWRVHVYLLDNGQCGCATPGPCQTARGIAGTPPANRPCSSFELWLGRTTEIEVGRPYLPTVWREIGSP